MNPASIVILIVGVVGVASVVTYVGAAILDGISDAHFIDRISPLVRTRGKLGKAIYEWSFKRHLARTADRRAEQLRRDTEWQNSTGRNVGQNEIGDGDDLS